MMIISRKRFEEELSKVRNETLRDIDIDKRFYDVHNRIYELERKVFELSCKIEKQDAEETKCVTN